eukprot:TRINITY_DN12636_c0_g1_i1.p1 TRINITY_DN12636_c0_g1~~TRINITY_DN12636_c0_g1_i1.p1  ORF type:complete len:335 (+),score=92.25 TRINITY_DN12636_c0_g1_i1:70-1074(+)
MLVPCVACGKACNGCVEGCMNGCRQCGPCCSRMTDCIANACKQLNQLCCPQNRPKPIFCFYTFLMSIIALAMSAKGIAADVPVKGMDCGTQDSWCYISIGMAILNVIFAVYIYFRFAEMMRRQREQEGQPATRQKKGCEQACFGPCFTCCDRCGIACELFCYDCGVFFYLCFVIWIIVYTIMLGDKKGDCGDKTDALEDVRLVWWLFLGIGVCVMCISMTCELSREPDPQQPGLHSNHAVTTAPGYPAYQQQPAAAAPYHAVPAQQAQMGYAPAPPPQQQAAYPAQQQQQQAYPAAPPQQYGAQPQQRAEPQGAAHKAGAALGSAMGKLLGGRK